jgi:hypothetical protein
MGSSELIDEPARCIRGSGLQPKTVNKRVAVHRLLVATRTVEWAPEPEFSKAEYT